MARIVSVSGVGKRGAAGLTAVMSDSIATVELLFDADPWDAEQPAAKGSVTIAFDGAGSTRAVPLDGWATLDPHMGNPATIQWTCAQVPEPGQRFRIALS